MTKTLVIHIGHYKTGTTALQVFCATNAAALARRGLAYSSVRRNFAKHSVYAYALLKAAGARTLLHGFANPRTPEDLWSELLAEVRASDAPVTLISSEEFMRLACFPAAMERLRAILAAAPDIAVRVIAYLRPMDRHLRSWHNQLVKLRVCSTGFDTTVRTGMEPIHLDYALALRPWAQLTDAARHPGRLIVRAYDDSLRQGDRMFADFLGSLGVRMPRWPSLPARDPNPRLDDRLVDLVRMARATGLDRAGSDQFRDRMQARLDTERQRRASETPDFAQIRARAEAGLREVASLAGREFPLQNFLSALPRPSDPHEAEREMLVEALMQDRATLLARIAELEALLAQPDAAPQPPAAAMPATAAKPG
jgi:hypothetical protein